MVKHLYQVLFCCCNHLVLDVDVEAIVFVSTDIDVLISFFRTRVIGFKFIGTHLFFMNDANPFCKCLTLCFRRWFSPENADFKI